MSPVDLIILAAVIYFLILIVSRVGKKRVQYIDQGSSEVYYSRKYRISAKPDLIEDRHTIVEKKSRRKGIYESDRKQLIATALAVRSRYPITRGVIETQSDREEIDLSGTDAALFARIEKEYLHAEAVNRGSEPPPYPSLPKCGGCQFRSRCDYSLTR